MKNALKVPTEEKSEISKQDAAKWQKLILAVNDRDLLEYIRELVSSRMDIGRAHHRINNPNTKYNDYRGPKKFPPMMESEPDNMDDIS